jgi:error-prone DNA polymerase
MTYPASGDDGNLAVRPFAHLRTRSWFSFQEGGSAPEVLVERAAALGVKTLAITDRQGVYAAARFGRACRLHEVRPIFGAEVDLGIDDDEELGSLVLLASSLEGYANLCRMLTALYQHTMPPMEALAAFSDDLYCLTATSGGRLWRLVDDRRVAEARAWLGALKDIFGSRLSVELAHHGNPGDRRRMQELVRLAHEQHVRLVATGDVLHATPEDYAVHDLLTCVRNGITVFDSHPERPRNAERHLKSESQLRKLIPYDEAFTGTAEVAEACSGVELLAEHITPPGARLPEGETAARVLTRRCRIAIAKKYPTEGRVRAAKQLEHELNVINGLDLADFFLVVAEVAEESRRRGIRCAGRGSAANSIVAYLLSITAVDPIRHNLLFERFLHGGRKGTPDIDVDFESDRRDEIIAWMEDRFGIEHTAMTATIVTYRLRSALRDVAKALGWPLEVVDRLSKAVPHGNCRNVNDHRVTISRALGAPPDAPLVNVLIEMVARLDDCPRHLGLHSGGMILSRKPLCYFTPVQTSANGVKVAQFAKDDVEALGLVKLDVLGLRMLSTISEADELIRRHIEPDFDLDAIPLDDVRTFNLIRASDTVGVFQIESHGQLHLLAANQPETFDDLIAEIALFRPGPLQGGMVNPYVRRRRGGEPVVYDHPCLEPILRDTYGIILFQEQVLEVAHQFAGMSLEEADAFRSLMSKFRDPGEMEGMRTKFVSGAMGRGIDEDTAQHVFDKVSKFVGFGFCRSHAAAFAMTVYQSAYMKTHYPAAFIAALMEHRPGMFNLMSLEEEARRRGVAMLMPCIDRSGVRYDVERSDGKLAIRKPLTSVRGMKEDDAKRIVCARLEGPFTSIIDLHDRVPLGGDVMKSLARSGALNRLAGGSSRDALWQIGLLGERVRSGTGSLFGAPRFAQTHLPSLPTVPLVEQFSWDYQTHGAARIHPMTLIRRRLTDLEIRSIETCWRFGRDVPVRNADSYGESGPLITLAGIVTLRQRPPTANGVVFITLEDETGFIQCIARPEIHERLDHVLRRSAMVVRGTISITGNWRGMVITDAWALDGIFGGYEGHLSMAGGLDKHVVRVENVGAGVAPPGG